MRHGISWYLVGIEILTLLLVPFVYFLPSPPVRIILGVIFLLFAPGFALMAVIAPREQDMGGTERLVLSLVLSVAASSLVGLALNYTPLGITVDSVLITMAVLVVITAAAGLAIQASLPENERASIEFRLETAGHSPGPANAIFTAAMVVVVIGALITGGYYVLAPKGSESFTQFYILDQEGATYTPTQLTVGGEASVIVGVTNHEGNETSYRVRVLLNGERYTETAAIALADGQEWQGRFTVAAESAGESQVEFQLFKGNQTQPYLKPLYLWLEVGDSIPAGSPPA